jgi:Hydroxymethylglutaryl-CoA reductase
VKRRPVVKHIIKKAKGVIGTSFSPFKMGVFQSFQKLLKEVNERDAVNGMRERTSMKPTSRLPGFYRLPVEERRAIEAGGHAYAARHGRYTSLTTFWLDDAAQALAGSIELPMAVGVVGGSTRVHPTVTACRKLLGPFAADVQKLAGLLAAVGLAQNTGALKALATEGIQKGHMRLHAKKAAS